MKIIAHAAENIETGITLISIADVNPEEMTATTTYENGKATDTPKLVEGKETYAVRGIVAVLDGRQQRNISIKVFNKPKAVITAGTRLRLAGALILTPYVSQDNRQGLSIIADSIEVDKA